MNWYKIAKKQPWQMTREEYNSLSVLPLKPNKVIYINNIEVIQNPTSSDMRQMTKEVRDKFPGMQLGFPALRSTQDENGNTYYWKAFDAVHSQIEPELSKITGSYINQNANKPLYNRMIYDSLKSGKNIPSDIFDEFSKKYPDAVKNINKGTINELV